MFAHGATGAREIIGKLEGDPEGHTAAITAARKKYKECRTGGITIITSSVSEHIRSALTPHPTHQILQV